jgi:hypothetical protein
MSWKLEMRETAAIERCKETDARAIRRDGVGVYG